MTDFRRPPPRYVLTRTGTAPDVVYCSTLADVDAAMRSWYPSLRDWLASFTPTEVRFWYSLGDGILLAIMTEVFE